MVLGGVGCPAAEEGAILDIGSLVGLIIGVLALLVPMSVGGKGLRGFLDPISAFLVLGCSLAATILHHPRYQIMQALRDMICLYREQTESPENVSALLVTLSQKARREGVLALENELDELSEGILRRGLQRVVDGTVPEALEQYMELELDVIEEQALRSITVFESMASYFPAFGMIGTIVGLIKMLLTMTDPSSLGASMALALVTTFYGAGMANLVCLPVAGRLQTRCDEDLLLGRMIARGLVAISAGENPSIVEETLSVYLLAGGPTAVESDEDSYEPESETMRAGVQ